MSFSTVSSRDLECDLAYAKLATTEGPVFVTDRGQRAYALPKIEDYYKLAGHRPKSLLEAMDALPGGEFEFEPPRLDGIGGTRLMFVLDTNVISELRAVRRSL